MKLAFSLRPFMQQSISMALFVFLQWQTNIWTTKVVRTATLDASVLPFLGFLTLNLAVVLTADRLARKLERSDRLTYIFIGALAGSVTQAVALAPAAYSVALKEGALSLLLVLPALLGAAMGFLLHRSLGYSAQGDEPDALVATIGESGAAATAYAATSTAEYYGGPLQVRDSSMSALIAAVIGSSLFMFIQAFAESRSGFLSSMVSPKAFGSMPTMFLSAIFAFTLPFYIFVKKSHAFLQARGKAELKSYVLAGLFVPGLFFVALLALLGPFALFVALPWIFPSMVTMGVYHRIAGMEPLSLPDDIEVSDRRTLIAADHPRRQMRRIVSEQSFGKAETGSRAA